MKEAAFAILSKDASSLLIWDSYLEVTARPAALSDGLDIFLPEDSLFRELDNCLVLADRLLAVFSATLFVFITTGNAFSNDCHVCGVSTIRSSIPLSQELQCRLRKSIGLSEHGST